MLGSNQVFLDAYDGIEVEIPGGKVVRCRPLALRDSARYLRLLMLARAGDPSAITELLERFPADVGAEDEFQTLTPGECFDLIDAFLAHRRPMKVGERQIGSIMAG